MRKFIAVAAVVVAMTTVKVWGQAMPAAGPEHKRLAYFAGTWDFKGEAKTTPMGPGGPVTFREVCELMPGGFALSCSSEGKTPMGPSKAVSIMSYDAEKKSYTYHAAESNMPAFTALGQVKGGTWNWTTESNMGGQAMKTRVTVTEGGPKDYDFLMEMSMGAGTFAPVISGKMTRVK